MTAIITDESLTLYHNGDVYNVNSNVINFNKIVDLVCDGMYDEAVELMDIKKAVYNHLQEVDGLVIQDDVVMWMGAPLHNYLATKILRMLQEGHNVDPMVKFLRNLLDNPSNRVLERLYEFLEYGNLPITEDGCFIAWKKVRSDFTDIYSGQFDNSPGSYVSVPRNQVDEDMDRTCSHGLHVCSQEYLGYFGSGPGNTVVQVKVNPKDVVAIPRDYNNTKMRTCAYEVLCEWAGATYNIEASVVTSDGKATTSGIQTVQDDSDFLDIANEGGYSRDSLGNWRNANGRFVSEYEVQEYVKYSLLDAELLDDYDSGWYDSGCSYY